MSIASAMPAGAKEMGNECKWWDEEHAWVAGCGYEFHFDYDGPTENGFLYCPNCSKLVKVEGQTDD